MERASRNSFTPACLLQRLGAFKTQLAEMCFNMKLMPDSLLLFS